MFTIMSKGMVVNLVITDPPLQRFVQKMEEVLQIQIHLFINNLPNGKNIISFTEDASEKGV